MTQIGPAPSSIEAWLFFDGLTGILLLPNPRRTLKPVTPGYAGRDFLAVTPGDDEVLTFDCRRFLCGALLIEADQWIVETPDPASALLDPSPGGRLILGPALDPAGQQVSARISGMVDGANYRMAAKVTDDNGNGVWVWAGIECRSRADWPVS